jgi:DNA polymerase-4
MEGQKLDWLFLDMNAYFASVEQELGPALRGRPTAVVPVLADTTCCIAASYEAKRFGVRTGTRVDTAKKLCPELEIIESRPDKYIEYHHRIIEAVNTVLPVDTVHSIDEMCCMFTGSQREYDKAVSIGEDVKRAIKERVGGALRCSVGLATNRFLAKVAAGMKKPDGFTVITREELPEKLFSLSLDDLPGIGPGMYARLRRSGIHSVSDLYNLSEDEFADTWQTVVGRRWWHLLRGEDLPEPKTARRTVGHSHVLPPQMRTEDKTRAVLVRLIHKAAFRLRRLKYLASRMDVKVRYFSRDTRWKRTVKIGKKSDTHAMIEAFSAIWPERPRGLTPLSVSVTLYELTPSGESAYPLFAAELKQDKLAHAVDEINERYGMNSIYYGPMHGASESAPLRIAFTSIPDIVAEGDKSERKL